MSLNTYDTLLQIHKGYFDELRPDAGDSQQQRNSSSFSSQFELLETIRYDPQLSTTEPKGFKEIAKQNFLFLSEHANRLKFTMRFFHRNIMQSGTQLDFEITDDYLFREIVENMERLNKEVDVPYKIRALFQLDGTAKFEFHNTAKLSSLQSLLHIKNEAISEDIHEAASGNELLMSSNEQFDNAIDNVWDVYVNNSPTHISPFTSFKTTKRDEYSKARANLPGKNPGHEEVLLYNEQSQLMEGSITNVAVKRPSDGKWITPLLSSGCLCGVTREYLLGTNYIVEQTITMDQVKPGTEVLLFNGIMGVVKGKIVR